MTLVSVIIATFNSHRTLPMLLTSIRKQTYPQNCIEVLIVDGGSTDSTITIAKKFNCRIIHNPKVEPLYAKYLGYKEAKGKFIVYIDHDEVFTNQNSLKNKIDTLQRNADIKVVIGSGYKSPSGYHAINKYINEFGEPFSFFMYRLSKNSDFFIQTMRQRYSVVKDTENYIVFNLSSSQRIPLIELTTTGSTIDGSYFKKTFPQVLTKYYLIPHLLYLLPETYSHIAIMKDDVLLHYSSDSFHSYLQKIIWRVKNNIFYVKTIGASGFTGREDYQSTKDEINKYLFIPYAFTLFFPIIDAISLSVSRKDISYMLHVPLTLLTASLILFYATMKYVGIKPKLTSYDGSTVAYENC